MQLCITILTIVYSEVCLITCSLFQNSEAMATIVCLNKDYRPTRMFPEMVKLLQVFSPN